MAADRQHEADRPVAVDGDLLAIAGGAGDGDVAVRADVVATGHGPADRGRAGPVLDDGLVARIDRNGGRDVVDDRDRDGGVYTMRTASSEPIRAKVIPADRSELGPIAEAAPISETTRTLTTVRTVCGYSPGARARTASSSGAAAGPGP